MVLALHINFLSFLNKVVFYELYHIDDVTHSRRETKGDADAACWLTFNQVKVISTLMASLKIETTHKYNFWEKKNNTRALVLKLICLTPKSEEFVQFILEFFFGLFNSWTFQTDWSDKLFLDYSPLDSKKYFKANKLLNSNIPNSLKFDWLWSLPACPVHRHCTYKLRHTIILTQTTSIAFKNFTNVSIKVRLYWS